MELENQVLQTWDRKGKRPMRLLPDPKTVSAGVDGIVPLTMFWDLD